MFGRSSKIPECQAAAAAPRESLHAVGEVALLSML